MYYDQVRNAYIDTETGAIVPIEDGDFLPNQSTNSERNSQITNSIGGNRPRPAQQIQETDQMRADREFAERLQSEYSPQVQQPHNFVSRHQNQDLEGHSISNPEFSEITYQPTPTLFDRVQSIFSSSEQRRVPNPQTTENPQGVDDWSLARALQNMEFEMAQEMRMDEDFTQKEFQASKCRLQMLSFSTLVCVVQIAIFAAMVGQDGFVSYSLNPMIGPPVTTLVRYGAKVAALIVYRSEWYRLFSPIFLHAGILHLLCNVLVQLRVGGYLNVVFGTPRWAAIYFLSGIFGNISSCIFLPDSVGVGSSGAVMGMLTAWLAWILFRWNRIPVPARRQRNCQLGVVLASVAVTLGMSFAKYVDWCAHFGGSLMGLLISGALLSGEMESPRLALGMRSFCSVAALSLFIAGFYYLGGVERPDPSLVEVWDSNDDWGKH